jgi:hypothetical protein
MRIQGGSAQESGTWFIEQNPAGTAPLKKLHASAQLGGIHAVIVFSLFLVLFAATVLIGGHAAIDPLLQSADEVHDARTPADVVYAMPDGEFCRHMSYDNVTGEQTGGSIRRCDNDIAARTHTRSYRHFTWQAN